MPRPDYGFNTRDVASESTRVGLWSLIIGVVAIIVVIILSMFIWGWGVASSPAKGKGDAFKEKNSGTNRIAAQERYVDLYNEVLKADKTIDTMAAAAKAQPNSTVAQTNLTGAITYCQQVVADYDTLHLKYTSADYRPADLPEQIDETDPTTDCKETTP